MSNFVYIVYYFEQHSAQCISSLALERYCGVPVNLSSVSTVAGAISHMLLVVFKPLLRWCGMVQTLPSRKGAVQAAFPHQLYRQLEDPHRLLPGDACCQHPAGAVLT